MDAFLSPVSARVSGLALLLLARVAVAADAFPEETAYRQVYDSAAVALLGRVVDADGAPLAGSIVRCQSGAIATAAPDGTFVFPELWRSNQVLEIERAGYYRHLIPVCLRVPLAETNLVLPPVVLWPNSPGVVRLLFGGDTAFARRMLDPAEQSARDQMPVENPEALISVADPLPGTLGIVEFVKPLFLAADYPVVNFESVVTRDPSTPHWQKEYVYFTLPESLPALRSLNIDYVGLGNNHVYDYLESGVRETIRRLNEAGLRHSGLGTNSASALQPYRTSIRGVPHSFLSMTSIGGEAHQTNYVADSAKGGAAYIEATEEARSVIAAEKAAGRVTILQAHVGDEYTFQPSKFARKWMQFGVEAGADLVVSHHPHVAQGFGMHQGVLLVHSLGNLFFDQDRLETMIGLVATVDMEGNRVRRAWGTPVYIEDYRPRQIAGRVAPVLLRRISEFSESVRAFPYNGQAWVTDRPTQYTFTTRRVFVPVTIGPEGWAVIDLRDWAAPDESLSRIESDNPALAARPGRDLMNFGDFEDADVDGDNGEASRWDFGTSSVISLKNRYRGVAALCLKRTKYSNTDAVAAFRNRVRVMGDPQNAPNKDLSLVGYLRGQESGPVAVVARYYASEGTAEFGEERPLEHPGGTFGWTLFARDLHMPADLPPEAGDPFLVSARALRIFLRHSPPVRDSGYAWFDELAVVNWEETVRPATGPMCDTPHARDFLRVEAPPGTHRLALEFRAYRPREADAGHGPQLDLEPERPDQSARRLWFAPTTVGAQRTLRLVLRNGGNQNLVAANLVFSGGNPTDFSARWLTMEGVPTTDPAVGILPGRAGGLEIRFHPGASGPKQTTLRFQSNDPDDTEAQVEITVGAELCVTGPARAVFRNRTREPLVEIQVPANAHAAATIVEDIPAGAVPAGIGSGGLWAPESRTLRWLNVKPGCTLAYSLSGAPNCYALSGRMLEGTQATATAGDALAVVQDPPDADEDGLPDWWENRYFDSRTAADPEADTDRDGSVNRTEFLRETHPLDGFDPIQSLAPILHILSADDRTAALRVVGHPGLTYALEQSADLQAWSLVYSNLASGQTVPVPEQTGAGEKAFFRASTLGR